MGDDTISIELLLKVIKDVATYAERSVDSVGISYGPEIGSGIESCFWTVHCYLYGPKAKRPTKVTGYDDSLPGAVDKLKEEIDNWKYYWSKK